MLPPENQMPALFPLLATLLPAVGLGLHVLTHLAVARRYGRYTIELESVVPCFRLRLDYDESPSTRGLRVVALAPLLVGLAGAVLVMISGLWDTLHAVAPYYLHPIAIISWVAYAHVGLADVRTALSPQQYV